MANSIIEAQEEFFDRKAYMHGPTLGLALLYPKLTSPQRARKYHSDMQRDLWDIKLQEENDTRIQK